MQACYHFARRADPRFCVLAHVFDRISPDLTEQYLYPQERACISCSFCHAFREKTQLIASRIMCFPITSTVVMNAAYLGGRITSQ